VGGATIGVNICEDIWVPAGPTREQALPGAELIINISASPTHSGKGAARERMLATRAADNFAFVAFCNLVGGQDELVFEGGSSIFDQQGEMVARAKLFEEELLVADLDLSAVFRQRLHDPRRRQEQRERPAMVSQQIKHVTSAPLSRAPVGIPAVPRIAPRPGPEQEIYQALMLGTRDYVRKNGFEEAVLGLSGRIDSALTAVVAANALGPEHVTGVFMSARYSSQ
jgi:NAD+ synthase (glutamine-hydrolysing)